MFMLSLKNDLLSFKVRRRNDECEVLLTDTLLSFRYRGYLEFTTETMNRMHFNFVLLALCLFLSPLPSEAAGDELAPLITTSEFVVGRNRFGFGLLSGTKFVNDAAVTLRIYAVEGSKARLTGEAGAIYRPIQVEETQGSVHRHADGSDHVHSAETGIQGMYTAEVEFQRAGTWGIEMTIKERTGALKTVRLSVAVLEASVTPPIGSPAPQSRNLIASDVPQLRQIDTSSQPDPRLHQVRIADAIAQRRPQLIVFATPQFCTSRMCGPTVEIVRTLLPSFGKRVAFTHQEIWQDFAEKKVFATVEEWRLKSEPWIFLVNRDGIIDAKFEGLVTNYELEKALEKILN
jgi:hypothetical protein